MYDQSTSIQTGSARSQLFDESKLRSNALSALSVRVERKATAVLFAVKGEVLVNGDRNSNTQDDVSFADSHLPRPGAAHTLHNEEIRRRSFLIGGAAAIGTS